VRSPRPNDFTTVYDLVHLYLEVIERLGADQLTLIGFSFGNCLAAEIAATSSRRLNKLMLVDAFGIKRSDNL
jgi:pimeloyl-ACP methyl ester carboxylesterase